MRFWIKILPDRSLSGRILGLACPVVLGMISQTLVGLVNTAMLGRLGAEALAAAGLGGLAAWTIIGSLGTVGVGTQILVSRRYGEGEKGLCGRVLSNSLMVSALLGFLLSGVGFWWAGCAFPLLSRDPRVVELGSFYIRYRFLGSVFVFLMFSLRGFFDGIGKTSMYMRVMIVVSIFNVILNYVLIFGKFGFPMLGVKGAAIALTLSDTIGAVLFLSISLSRRYLSEYGYLDWRNFSLRVVGRIFALSYSPALRSLLTMGGFLAFSWVVGKIGTAELAAINVVMTITSLSFTPGFGMGIAASTLVGQMMGAGDFDGAERCGWESMKLGIILMGAIGIVFIALPEPILRLFTSDLAVISRGIGILRIWGAVQAFDACGIVLSNALQGAGNTRWVMWMEVSINWFLFLPSAYIFGVVLRGGLYGAWTGLLFYVFAMALATIWKFGRGGWKGIVV